MRDAPCHLPARKSYCCLKLTTGQHLSPAALLSQYQNGPTGHLINVSVRPLVVSHAPSTAAVKCVCNSRGKAYL